MSRSGLSARFSELVGDSVKSYITEWRMQLAREELLTTTQTLATLAEKYGYQSEAAFSRAISRIYTFTALTMLLAIALTARIPELPLRTTHDWEAAREPSEA